MTRLGGLAAHREAGPDPADPVIILSFLFPGPDHPTRGMFVASQARALSRALPVLVVSPVARPIASWSRGQGIRGIPEVEDDGSLRIFRPRYPALPWHLDLLDVYTSATAVGRTLHRVGATPRLIHAHFAHPGGFVASLLARQWRIPFLVTLHGWDVNVLGRTADRRAYGTSARRADVAVWRWMMHAVLRRADRVICVSDELRAKAVALGAAPDRLVTVRNGVDPTRFYPADQRAARRQLGLAEDGTHVLFAGSLQWVKGPDVLIEAARTLVEASPRVQVSMLGDGPMRPSLEAAIRRTGLQARVTLWGTRPYSEMPRWMNACDVLAVPSRYESFGCVVIEALACGRPVVASRAGGIPEVITDGIHGRLVEAGNPRQLAEAITDTVHRRWDGGALATFGRRHSWSSVASDLLRVYETLSASTA